MARGGGTRNPDWERNRIRDVEHMLTQPGISASHRAELQNEIKQRRANLANPKHLAGVKKVSERQDKQILKHHAKEKSTSPAKAGSHGGDGVHGNWKNQPRNPHTGKWISGGTHDSVDFR